MSAQSRLHDKWYRDFERRYLELRSYGLTEDQALDEADRLANVALDLDIDAKVRDAK